MSTERDERHMRRAIELAERGWGKVAPNPLVGTVVVAGGTVVGEGYHAHYGEDHAEVVALRDAGSRAEGSTLYVNLEPCSHQGNTPPCERVIREAGVHEVVVGCLDPNPAASGGLERLEASGIRVRLTRTEEAQRLNAPFLWNVTQEVPYVALKLAISLDGRIAARPGVRTAVTGEEALGEVHRLRAGFEAVLIGRGTAEADDPLLTARGSIVPRVPPIRVVIDSGLRLERSSRLLGSIAEAPVWLVGVAGASARRRGRLEKAGVHVLEVKPEGSRVDLPGALRTLKDGGVGSVLVEGGSAIASALLRQDLVHRIYLFVAPVFLGDGGLPAFAAVAPSDADEWEVSQRRGLGRDTLIVMEHRAALERLEGAAGG